MAKQPMLKFVKTAKEMPQKRDANVRSHDFNEIYREFAAEKAAEQASRCSQCGVPYCHTHCPLHNNIPDWLRLTAEGRLQEAYEMSQATNTFPEICGRICPQDRLCEGNCVIEQSGHGTVTIGAVEKYITDTAFDMGWVKPIKPATERAESVGIIGAGPGGLAAADALRRAGVQVTVYDRYDRAGGLMTYGIPGFKLEKDIVMQRVKQLEDGGVEFVLNCNVGTDISFDAIRGKHDAVLIATGVYKTRELTDEGADAAGIVRAIDYLTASNRKSFGDDVAEFEDGTLNAEGKRVIVIGGGDTGTDCIGTSLRHGCETLTNFELFPQPPDTRAEGNPWPAWPRIYRTDYGHEEAAHRYGEDQRRYSILSKEFVGDESGKVKAVKTTQISVGADGRFEEVAGTEKEWPADLVVLAMGFRHPEATISETLKLEADARNNVKANTADYRTSSRGVFAAGDCRRGQSLVVWAINEGRNSAAACDAYLRQGPEASW